MDDSNMSMEDRGTMKAIHTLRAAIDSIDIAASYNPALYALRDTLVEQLAVLEDSYNSDEE